VVNGNLRRTNYTTRFYCAVINALLVKYGLNKAEMIYLLWAKPEDYPTHTTGFNFN